jgi:phenylacetate-CoA ligase
MTGRMHLSRAELRATQLEQLRSLVTELFPANAFYTRKLEDCGVTFDVASLADFSARFPFTTKAELVADQQARPPFGTNLTYPPASYTRFHQTSGTTGTPLRWLDTPESWEWLLEQWQQVFVAAGVRAEDRVCFAFSFGPFLGFWTAFESAARLGCLCLPAGGMSSVARLHLLLDNAATVLCCTPTYALRLGEAAREAGLDLSRSRVRRIVVAGEPGGSIPATRARIEQLWPGARVFDHHGMTEVGPVTYECPAQPGVLHVLEAGFYAEIVEPASGRPVQPGCPGELILTPLGRIASPLLRYRTGDLVQSVVPADAGDAPCACGSHELALAGGILGRVDDMVIVRGVNIYPAAVEEVIRAVGGIAEYQAQVTARGPLTELAVTIEPEPGCADAAALAAKLLHAFDAAFALRLPVKLAAPGTLPRFEMKSKRWLRVSGSPLAR